MGVIQDLIVRLTAETGQYKSEMASAKGANDDFTNSLKEYATQALSGLGITLGVAEAFRILENSVQSSIAAASEAQAMETKLGAVVAATGGAAGTTATQMVAMAEGLSKISGVEADTIKNSEALMATFYNVGKNTFPVAMKAALDMSAVLGQDLQSSVMQLGKALQDPGGAFTSLQRVGIMFTDAQKSIIQSLTAAGDIAGAQAKILDEVNKEFGGAAQANALTYAGSVNAVQNSFKGLGESLAGGQTLGAMKEFNFVLSDTITLLAQYYQETQFKVQSPTDSRAWNPSMAASDESQASQRRAEQAMLDQKQTFATITANLNSMGIVYRGLTIDTDNDTNAVYHNTQARGLSVQTLEAEKAGYRGIQSALKDLASAQAVQDAAEKNLKTLQDSYLKSTGNDLVQNMGTYIPAAGKKQIDIMKAADAAFGTTTYAAYLHNQTIEKLNRAYLYGGMSLHAYNDGLKLLAQDVPQTTDELTSANEKVLTLKQSVDALLSTGGTWTVHVDVTSSGVSGGGSGHVWDNPTGEKMAGGGMASGGWTLVGEQGPEIVNLPASSYVNTSSETNQIMSSVSQVGGLSDRGVQAIVNAIHSSRLDEAKLARSMRDQSMQAGVR